MKYPLLVSNPTNIFYLTGISVESRDAWVLITEEETHFFTDARYNDILLKFAHKTTESRLNSPIISHKISSEQPLSVLVHEILVTNKTPQLFYEADNITVSELKNLKKKLALKLIATANLLATIREIKQKNEITKIQKACNTMDACLHDISKLIRPGLTEYDIAYKIDSWLREKAYESAFPPIVATNEDAAIPHFNTQLNGKKRISKNAIILIDAGAKVDGYCSDITRMFVVGKASTTFMNTYNKMLDVQLKTIEKLGTYKKYSDIDIFCRTELERSGVLPHTHATGHGIGIDVHEKPYISFSSKDNIKCGHTVTIEPGTYIEGQFGIRIEDTVLIGDNGLPIVLTKFSKAL